MKIFAITALLAITATMGQAAPHIFHITKTAAAGQVVGIQGDQFGTSPTVWFDRLEIGDTTANPETQIAVSDVLTSSNQYIAVKLPALLPAGVYAFFVNIGAGPTDTSPPAYVNRADAWHALDLAGKEIRAGTTFRISGRNLVGGVAPQVRFVNSTNGAVTATVAGSSTYGDQIIQCTVPTSGSVLSVGQSYHVQVNNGLSDHASTWTQMPGIPLLVRAPVIAPLASDPFGTGVPWGDDFAAINNNVFNVTSYGADPADDTDDDRAAIQSAIDAAKVSGGTVYLPNGVYNIYPTYVPGVGANPGVDYFLRMYSNVVLKGQSKADVIIKSAGVPTPKPGPSSPPTGNAGLIFGVVTTKTGFKDLTLKGNAHAAFVVNYLSVNTRCFMVNCDVQTDGPQYSHTVGWRGGYEGVIRDSNLSSTNTASRGVVFTNFSNLILKNCNISYFNDRPDFNVANNVQIEGSEFKRLVNPTPYIETGGIAAPAKDFTLLNCTFSRQGSLSLIPNDGESLLCEYISGGKALSVISGVATEAVTLNSILTDSTQTWTTTPKELVGFEIFIIRGPGMGQRRTILDNTANTLKVAAWAVAPVAAQSAYVVQQRYPARHLIAGNTFNSVRRGVWYYRTPVDDLTIVGNEFTDTPYPVVINGTQRYAVESYSAGEEFNPMTGILVQGNDSATTGSNPYTEDNAFLINAVVRSGTQNYGNLYYDTVFRGNVTSGTSDTVGVGLYAAQADASSLDNTNPTIIGMIIEDNVFQSFKYGVSISTGNSQTVIKGNTFTTIGANINDFIISPPTHVHASVGTVIIP